MAPAMNAQPDMNQPRTPATDSRALQNLIKAEKVYVENLFSATSAAMSAASSLQAWGMSETPDMEKATLTVTKWLEDVASAQRTHGQAIDQFREALKDVLDREHSIRTILRDREILISRVIKSSKRKPSRWEVINGDEEHQARISEAQQELHACEQLLANESALLVGVKRRTFKEALAMRVKTMGDTGAVMMDSARSILLYLDEFDANVPVAPMPPAPLPAEAAAEAHEAYGTPSVIDHGAEHEHSAPMMIKNDPLPAPPPAEPHRAPSAQLGAPYVDAVETPTPEVRSPPRLSRSLSAQASHELRGASAEREPVRRPRKSRSRAPSDASHRSGSAMYLPQVPGGVPSAPRVNVEHMRSDFLAPTVPGGVPTAPGSAFRTTHANDDSSSDEGGRRRMRGAYAPSSTDASTVPPRRAHRRADSSDDEAPHHRRKGSASGGFFQRVSSLFRTEVKAHPSPGKHERRASRSEGLFAPIGDMPRATHAARDDSSDDETPRNVVRHINERPGSSMSSRNLMSPQRGIPGMRRSASAMGRSVQPEEDDELMAAVRRSVIGAGIQGTTTKPPSRPSSRASATGARATHAGARSSRRRSVDLGETSLTRNVPDATGPKLRTRSSSEQLGEKPTARRKRRDSANARPSHPPPAPSSFYVGFSNNPGKFATDSWVAKAGDAPASTTFETPTAPPPVTAPSAQRTPVAERTRATSYLSPSSSRSQPAKSALKGSKGTAAATPKRLSMQDAPKDEPGLSLDLDNRFDGTGHIDFELAEMISTGMSPTKETPSAPAASAAPSAPAASTAASTEATDCEAFRSLVASEQPGGHQGLAPPLVGLPSFYTAAASTSPVATPAAETPAPAQAPAQAPAPVAASPNARKSVRIESDEPVAHAPVARDDDDDDDDVLAGGRPRSSWSTRIGTREDSSDEETESGNPDGYKNARKAFGSATRHLGLATGTIQPKSEARKKKSKALDYNPSVQLPAGLHSIARSRH
ncbi:hypothetical protein GLX27_002552 [Malassezia furfur]|uniref:Uncharacterized protein n=1 Tax=Malassezia furfur TaxID=55194 RepID=A0ABY8EQL6_MALFU|nr:hypothetical protein GLX27_002552 [Malassezia furfur]